MLQHLKHKPRQMLILGVCGVALALATLHEAISGQSIVTSPAPRTSVEILAEVPKNGAFYCDQNTAEAILRSPVTPKNALVTNGKYPPFLSVPHSSFWVFTKHNGKIYVHGFTAHMSRRSVHIAPVQIYAVSVESLNDDNTIDSNASVDQPITLQAGTFHLNNMGVLPGFQSVNNAQIGIMAVSHIHPDNHFGDVDWTR